MAAKKGLGKGLGALILNNEEDNGNVAEIDINKIEPNKNQPRKYFDETALQELADSIRQYGIIQPLIVTNNGEFYTIVAGERRWRAARLAKIDKVPVIIKEYTNAEIVQIALIENIQRKDLNPIEQALCYRRLVDEFFFTQEAIAQKVSKGRSSITNSLRLLNLDERVQMFVLENRLSEALARALLSVPDKDLQFNLAKKFMEDQFSMREATAYIKNLLANQDKPEQKKDVQKEIIYEHIERDLKTILGTPVLIKEKNYKGRIEIEYHSHDELDRLLSIFKSLQDRERN